MNDQKLFALVDELEPFYFAFWQKICSMETRSDDIAALNAQSDVLCAYAKEHGLSIERRSYPAAGDTLVLLLTGSGNAEGEEAAPVALMAHMDTVHEKGAFGPVPVRVKGDTLYGPGVGDCKGGLVTALLVMEALRQLGVPHRPVKLVLDSDEESGEHLGNEARANFHFDATRGCAAAINCETGVKNALTVGRKGVLRIAVDVHGKSGHAGNVYFESVSAIREAAYKIVEIEKHSAEGGLTFNVGRLSGGSVVNIVPDACHFEIDIRFLNERQYEEAVRIVQKIVDTSYVPGSSAEMRILHKLPAMEKTGANLRLFDKIASYARETGLEEFEPIVRGGGSDAAFPVLLGIPTVCSAGAVGNEVHTVRESAEIASLARRAKILAGAILRL